MVSASWRSMEAEERSKWENIASDDKDRFEKAKATYRGLWTAHRSPKIKGICYLQLRIWTGLKR